MKLYGVTLKARYACFDSYHVAVSKHLFKTEQEATDYIPFYEKYIIEECKTKHSGFYTLDKDSPIKCHVIDFEIDL